MEQDRRQEVHEILESIQDNKRLIALVMKMSRELARLDEDNLQLRAAVGIYRELMRRHQRV